MLESVGLRELATSFPLASYRYSSFESMRNDSLDRFGTKVERRFERDQVVRLMQDAALVDVHVADTFPFWHAIGSKSPATA